MKRTKKLLALALALMMAFSCMAMPAMAHGDEDEGIMPLYEVHVCPKCLTGEMIEEKSELMFLGQFYSFPCKVCGQTHTLQAAYIFSRWKCLDCSYVTTWGNPEIYAPVYCTGVRV